LFIVNDAALIVDDHETIDEIFDLGDHVIICLEHGDTSLSGEY
jgi:hypothetical protein